MHAFTVLLAFLFICREFCMNPSNVSGSGPQRYYHGESGGTNGNSIRSEASLNMWLPQKAPARQTSNNNIYYPVNDGSVQYYASGGTVRPSNGYRRKQHMTTDATNHYNRIGLSGYGNSSRNYVSLTPERGTGRIFTRSRSLNDGYQHGVTHGSSSHHVGPHQVFSYRLSIACVKLFAKKYLKNGNQTICAEPKF